MSDVPETKKAKDRSPGFPFIDLRTALERARQMYNEEKRGIAPFLRLAMHWKYSEKSSGALQTVAALKNYGLLSENSSATGSRQFQLTELALRIILDQREDSTEREQFIQKAALNPLVAREVYAKWPDGLPSDGTINHYLVLDKKFTPSSALSVTKILKQNHIFASIRALDGLSESVKIDEEDDNTQMEDMIDTPTVQRREQANVPVRQTASLQRQNAPGAPDPELVYLPDGKVFTMQFNSVPDLATYEMLKSFVEWKIKLFAPNKSGGKDNPSDEKTETKDRSGADQP